VADRKGVHIAGLAVGDPIRAAASLPEEPSNPDVGPTRLWYGTVERGKPTILSVRTRFPLQGYPVNRAG